MQRSNRLFEVVHVPEKFIIIKFKHLSVHINTRWRFVTVYHHEIFEKMKGLLGALDLSELDLIILDRYYFPTMFFQKLKVSETNWGTPMSISHEVLLMRVQFFFLFLSYWRNDWFLKNSQHGLVKIFYELVIFKGVFLYDFAVTNFLFILNFLSLFG